MIYYLALWAIAALTNEANTMPLWALVVGMVLAGGSVAAVFGYLAKRTEAKAEAPLTEASADEVSIRALTNTINTLSAENGRLTGRLTDFNVIFDRMELALGTKLDAARSQLQHVETKLDDSKALVIQLQNLLEERPTKSELIEQIGRLIEQLAQLGVSPTNGPPR